MDSNNLNNIQKNANITNLINHSIYKGITQFEEVGFVSTLKSIQNEFIIHWLIYMLINHIRQSQLKYFYYIEQNINDKHIKFINNIIKKFNNTLPICIIKFKTNNEIPNTTCLFNLLNDFYYKNILKFKGWKKFINFLNKNHLKLLLESLSPLTLTKIFFNHPIACDNVQSMP